ncbi:mite group 2 allergen Gly d 2.02-like [Artemia franciscana]|uniref:MD-2-related lipid-recognition domain-containing protein n=1 Tax=Artemia franciscana TaxID=6661 RepID=A0AA88HB51_ARTSF|nr:hypothetical protein QYM36_014936 [Artemia franciscana]
MHVKLICVVLFTPIICDELKLFKQCGKTRSFGTAGIDFIRINPCSKNRGDEPCAVKRGDTAVLEIGFTPKISKPVQRFTAKGFWVRKNSDFLIPNMKTNGCDFATCPLENNKPVVYTFKLRIPIIAPSMMAMVRWIMKSPDEEFDMCLEFPVIIK